MENRKEKEFKKLLFNFSALVDLGEEITSTRNFRDIIKSALYILMGTLSVSKGAICQHDYKNKQLAMLASKGIKDPGKSTLIVNESLIRKVVTTKKPFSPAEPDEAIASFYSVNREAIKGTHAAILMPLVVREELIGMIFLGEKFFKQKYTPEDFEILSVMAHQIAVSLYNHSLLKRLANKVNENRALYDDLRLVYNNTISAFAAAIDSKDAYTKNHSRRVAIYSMAIAEEMGWSKEDTEGIYNGGLLHDIGKLIIDKTIINKDRRLTDEEFGEMYRHPLTGYEILSRIKFPWKEIPRLARSHHEKVNGSGYPDHLDGKDIPLGAKIMAIADTFDAMTTDRPYRQRLSLLQALMEVKNYTGIQFDPEVATAFFRTLQKEIRGATNPHILSHIERDFDHQFALQFLNTMIN